MAIRLRHTSRRDGLSRSMIEQYLADAPDGLTVEELSARLGRHPNTVRGHLDVLVSRGLVARVTDQPAGPGRPRHRYRVADSPPGALDHHASHAAVVTLAAAVAEELGPSLTDPGLTVRAGQRWAQQVASGNGAEVRSADDSVRELAETMRRAGFDAEVDRVGDRMYLADCPYGAMVATAPAICELHLHLAQATVAEHAAGVVADHLDVGVTPGLCVLHLLRPDREPRRVVSRPEEGPTR